VLIDIDGEKEPDKVHCQIVKNLQKYL